MEKFKEGLGFKTKSLNIKQTFVQFVKIGNHFIRELRLPISVIFPPPVYGATDMLLEVEA